MKNSEEILHVIEPSPLCAIYFFVYPSTKEEFYFSLKCNSLFNNCIAWGTSQGKNVIFFQLKLKILLDLLLGFLFFK